jgi:hypothetical protein
MDFTSIASDVKSGVPTAPIAGGYCRRYDRLWGRFIADLGGTNSTP